MKKERRKLLKVYMSGCLYCDEETPTAKRARLGMNAVENGVSNTRVKYKCTSTLFGVTVCRDAVLVISPLIIIRFKFYLQFLNPYIYISLLRLSYF